jgi:hypothetical protein
MALSEMELSVVSRRQTQTQEKPATPEPPRTLFSSKELTDMMLHQPEELTAEHPVSTPAGTWSMQGRVAEFTPKSGEELNQITAPDNSLRRKLAKIFQM